MAWVCSAISTSRSWILRAVAQAASAGTLSALNGSFRRTLRAEDQSERTVKGYTEAVRLFADYQRLHAVHAADHAGQGRASGRNILESARHARWQNLIAAV
jgi:hypothetical protein